MTENNEQKKKCETCDKEVPAHSINREGDCSACRAADRASDMTVGDLGGR